MECSYSLMSISIGYYSFGDFINNPFTSKHAGGVYFLISSKHSCPSLITIYRFLLQEPSDKEIKIKFFYFLIYFIHPPTVSNLS